MLNKSMRWIFAASLFSGLNLNSYAIQPVLGTFPAQAVFQSTPTLLPVRDGKFGKTDSKNGLSIESEPGSPVLAAGPGTVISVEKNSKSHRAVVLDHGKQMKTRYDHLGKVQVHVGQEVKRGETLGTLDKMPLYYQVLDHDAPVNPIPYISEK